MPTPARTATAYRLYSEQDVDRVRRMRALIGAASRLSGRREVLVEREASSRRPRRPRRPVRPGGGAHRRRRDALRRASLEEAWRGRASGSALAVFERVLGPAVDRVGNLWHSGEATVAQEHLISYVVLRKSMELLHLASPDAGRTALLCCFAEEEHLLPAIGAALCIASWGFRPVVLGARTPPAALASGVRGMQPDLVGLSVTIAPEAARARELVDAYADACGSVPWIVGGAGLPRCAPSSRARADGRRGRARSRTRRHRALPGARPAPSARRRRRAGRRHAARRTLRSFAT